MLGKVLAVRQRGFEPVLFCCHWILDPTSELNLSEMQADGVALGKCYSSSRSGIHGFVLIFYLPSWSDADMLEDRRRYCGPMKESSL